MNQKKQEEIELHLCNKLKKLPFLSRKQMDKVFQFATLVVRNKKVGFYVIDDTVSGLFIEKALKTSKELEKLKSSISIENITLIKKMAMKQKKIEEEIEELYEEIKKIQKELKQ